MEGVYEQRSNDMVVASVGTTCLSEYAYWVSSLYVSPSYRRKGLASALMLQLCADADRDGCDLVLEASPFERCYPGTPGVTSIPLDDLIAFYVRFGFVVQKRGRLIAYMVRNRRNRYDRTTG